MKDNFATRRVKAGIRRKDGTLAWTPSRLKGPTENCQLAIPIYGWSTRVLRSDYQDDMEIYEIATGDLRFFKRNHK